MRRHCDVGVGHGTGFACAWPAQFTSLGLLALHAHLQLVASTAAMHQEC